MEHAVDEATPALPVDTLVLEEMAVEGTESEPALSSGVEAGGDQLVGCTAAPEEAQAGSAEAASADLLELQALLDGDALPPADTCFGEPEHSTLGEDGAGQGVGVGVDSDAAFPPTTESGSPRYGPSGAATLARFCPRTPFLGSIVEAAPAATAHAHAPTPASVSSDTPFEGPAVEEEEEEEEVQGSGEEGGPTQAQDPWEALVETVHAVTEAEPHPPARVSMFVPQGPEDGEEEDEEEDEEEEEDDGLRCRAGEEEDEGPEPSAAPPTIPAGAPDAQGFVVADVPDTESTAPSAGVHDRTAWEEGEVEEGVGAAVEADEGADCTAESCSEGEEEEEEVDSSPDPEESACLAAVAAQSSLSARPSRRSGGCPPSTGQVPVPTLSTMSFRWVDGRKWEGGQWKGDGSVGGG